METLPITYDVASKRVKLSEDASLSQNKPLRLEIDQLNTISKEVQGVKAEIPPPPAKEFFSKQLSMMVKKMHESAVSSLKAGKSQEAIKQFDVALGLATARPKFESFQMTIPEVMVCLIGRCDAYLKNSNWLEAYLDAELLCQLVPNAADNYLRKGICNMKLGNLQDAKSDFERGLCFNATHPKVLEELANVKQMIAEENGEL